jgi:hypothetical protein
MSPLRLRFVVVFTAKPRICLQTSLCDKLTFTFCNDSHYVSFPHESECWTHVGESDYQCGQSEVASDPCSISAVLLGTTTPSQSRECFSIGTVPLTSLRMGTQDCNHGFLRHATQLSMTEKTHVSKHNSAASISATFTTIK